MPEAILKNYELTTLAEDISKQSNIDYVLWLLVANLMQIYNAKDKSEQEKI